MTKLTVALITRNEEDRLRPTLEAIKDIANEIVVVDSGSQDKTLDIAHEFNAKTCFHEFEGYSEQKNFLTSLCTGDFILFLDADEVVPQSLKEEIIEAINQDDINGFFINRKTHYLGKLLNKAWQPNFRLRLARRSANPTWVGDVVHEQLKVDGKTANLKAHIVHYSYRNIEDHYNRTIKYAKLSALSYYKKGKKASLFKILVNPFFSFFKLYIIKLGFIDGVPGLIAGVSAFIYTFLKYVFLYEMYLNKKD